MKVSEKMTENNASFLDPKQHNLPHRFSGKLLLRNEIPLDEETFQLLLSAKSIRAIKSIMSNKFSHQCQRCGNQKRSLFASIPCPSCKRTHLYCRKCIEMGRVIECESLYYWTGEEPKWIQHENPCSWDGQLTDVQQKAADRVVSALESKEKEILIWAVCGAGKTEMLFPGITYALQLGKRICIATPRADVVRELLPRFQKAFTNISIQGLYGGSIDKDGTAQLIIATTHQLLRYRHAFDLLIIDEIDAFPFHADASLPFAANRAKASQSTTIYLTATPRAQQRRQIARKKLPHFFVPIRFHGKPLPVPNLKMSFSLKKDLNKYVPPTSFMRWLQNRKNPARQLLIFVPTIMLADKLKGKLSESFQLEGMIEKTEHLTAVHASDPDREAKIGLFREKKIIVLLTTTILERGVTFPSVDVAVLDAGHTVFDEAAIVQIAGRAGRSPDDPTGEVVLFHDGKTDAMVQAIQSIQLMNKRGGFR